MSVSQMICMPGKSVTGKSESEFNVKQLLRVIQSHSFGDHRKAVEAGCFIKKQPLYFWL